MRQRMTGPILLPANAANIIMRQHAGPHQRRLRLIVLAVNNHAHSAVLNRQQNGLTHAVGNGVILCFSEITLQNMRHHITNPTGALIFGQSKSQLRV